MLDLLLDLFLANEKAEKEKQKQMNRCPKTNCAACKYTNNQYTAVCTRAREAIQFCMTLQLSSPIRRELIVYKTACDTINYVNYRHGDADSSAI